MKKWQEYFKSLAKSEHIISIISDIEMTFQIECFENDNKKSRLVTVHTFNECDMFWIEVDNAVFKKSKLMSFSAMEKCLKWADILAN